MIFSGAGDVHAECCALVAKSLKRCNECGEVLRVLVRFYLMISLPDFASNLLKVRLCWREWIDRPPERKGMIVFALIVAI